MRYYDVFNGDADGICALRQLRLADPVESTLVTGLKRDICLLESLPAGEGDVVTVLDLSLERNRAAVDRLLERGAIVRYFDHHRAGALPVHPRFEALIDESGAACTSALIDRHLCERFRPWAVVGAFGDNLEATALDLAGTLALAPGDLETLRELGASLNYNAYGASESDVLVAPADLYRIASRYRDPLALAREEAVIARLHEERHADLVRAMQTQPARSLDEADVYVLPDAPWSRRVSGTFANRLAHDDPRRAHAVLCPLPADGFVVSVRSPPGHRLTAVEFCRRFAGAGGRAWAAGIDRLDREGLDGFLRSFGEAWRA